MPDGWVPPDGAMPDGGPGGPTITICPGDALPPLTTGTCAVTAGTGSTLYTADVLTPGEVLRGGQVLVDASGSITCVACDCSSAAGASGATEVVCPDGVLSPGLINAHDHLTFAQNLPYTMTPERYEHRHDWRRGLRGHTRIGSSGSASENQKEWGELRFVLGGATSVNGSGGGDHFLRNLDSATAQEGLGQPDVEYDTFPLGDSDGTQLTDGCGYPMIATTTDIAGFDSYTPHISEGIDAVSRNEFLCARTGSNDLVQPQTAIIHGIGLLPPDIAEMGADGTALIWSPRSNVTLYGETARVTEYARLGVSIALGTDWMPTGSMNVLRELKCADELNTEHYDGFFSDEALWLMSTRDAAAALAVDDVLGTLAPGKVADLAIFASSDIKRDHRAIIDAQAADVVLVVRAGRALYGDEPVVTALVGAAACGMDVLDVCGTAKRICEPGAPTLATLQAANASAYPLFFCAEPMGEPSCLPARNADPPLPSPVVNESTRYAGGASADDLDGDGILNASDDCERVFNPIRPLDNGAQADFDRDGEGDSCDPCPLDPDTTTCTAPDPTDRDADGVPNTADNCPEVPNSDQADRDMDAKGDVCDPCPDSANPGIEACPATIYEVKNGTVAIGARVAIHGAIVTGVGANGFFMQVDPLGAGYMGPDYSGVFVYTSTRPTVAVGNRVDIGSSVVANFYGQIQLNEVTIVVAGTGAAAPAPIVVTPAEVATGGARATQLESVVVQVNSVTVTSVTPTLGAGDRAPSNEFVVTGNLRVNDLLYLTTPFPTVGQSFTSISGVLEWRNDNSKIEPRSAADYVSGPPVLSALDPALSYTREGGGAPAPTFPVPLTVRLSSAALTDTTIVLTSSDPAGLAVTNVVVPAGASSAVVPVTGLIASGTPYTVTATLDAAMVTARVRVLALAAAPRLAGVTPATASVLTGDSVTYRVELDIPAPPGGTIVDLSVDMLGTVPATVTVPADATGADFTFTAGTSGGTATITATLNTDVFTAQAMVTTRPMGSLVINEIDYDQPSTDTMEFIEIYNGTGAVADLTGLSVVLVNGSTSLDYASYPLSGTMAAGEYLVLANAAIVLPAGVRRIDVPDNSVQNGGPDGVVLYDTARTTIVDALSYEGSITSATIMGSSGQNLVEGTVTTAIDPGSAAQSLARTPNGADTNNAASDWRQSTTPTPGAPNT